MIAGLKRERSGFESERASAFAPAPFLARS